MSNPTSNMIDPSSKYEKINNFTKGGQGIISFYKVKETNEIVVVKDYATADPAKDRAHFEIMAKIFGTNEEDKKYLGEYLDYWFDDLRCYIVMPRYDEDLATFLIKTVFLSQKQILDLIEPIFKGIHYIHSRGYVHKDIKLENIMLWKNQIKIIDFGAVRKTNNTIVSDFIGSRLYAAPELFNIEKRKPNEKSDYFALGVVIMELCSRCRVTDIVDAVCFDLQGVNEDRWHGQMIKRMKMVEKPVCNALQSLAISLMRNCPEERPRHETVMNVLEAIRKGTNCTQIIEKFKLKDASKVPLLPDSAAFAVQTIPKAVIHKDLMEYCKRYCTVFTNMDEHDKNVYAAKHNQTKICITLTVFQCANEKAPMQLLFNESCIDESNQTAIDALGNNNDYKLFVPYLKVISVPELQATIVATHEIEITLLKEHATRVRERNYWTVKEILNWITPIAKAVEYMHKQGVVCSGEINMKRIIKDDQVRFFCDFEKCIRINETVKLNIQTTKNKDVIALGLLLLELITLRAPSSLISQNSSLNEDFVHGQLHGDMSVHPEVETAPFERLRDLVIQMIQFHPLLCVPIHVVRIELESMSQTLINK